MAHSRIAAFFSKTSTSLAVMFSGRFISIRRLLLFLLLFFALAYLELRNSSLRPADVSTPNAAEHEQTLQESEVGVEGPKETFSSTLIDSFSALRNSHSFRTGRKLKETAEQIQAKIQDLHRNWSPPQTILRHWPPYQWYSDSDYDPNIWEGFEWENGFYAKNGVKQFKAKPKPYLPYPDYNSPEYKNAWEGEYVPCVGPRGKLLNESLEDVIHHYPRATPDFPQPAVGDAQGLGIDINQCFDRHSRFGPYGNGYNETIDNNGRESSDSSPNWYQTRWGDLQHQCWAANRYRYRPKARFSSDNGLVKRATLASRSSDDEYDLQSADLHYHPRTALLIRTWTGYTYTKNDMESIRALITELSLLSGGEYQVFLLVNVKDVNSTFWKDDQAHQDILNADIPNEFHDITILWSEPMMQEWYPEVGNWEVYWHQFMPVQWFSKKHPEFDYVWNWETDARYIGNHYHFFEQMAKFAKAAPMKYLWERNARFYFPSVHGNYQQWLDDTNSAIDTAVHEGSMEAIWGPRPYNATIQTPIGSIPPHPSEDDNFQWGVGEEADLITLQPIWDPVQAHWAWQDKIFNFIPGVGPKFPEKNPLDEGFTHPEFTNIPRRVFINTVSRFSRKQLHAMHIENLAGRDMATEMWPATVALQHGLKAVYAPHPIWTDRRWPGWYMDAVFNADGNQTAQWGARGDSIYNHDREHNFAGWSWYYDSKFPQVLYRRWLGWSATTGSEEEDPNNPLRVLGGKHFEDEGYTYWVSRGSKLLDRLFGKRKIHVGGQGRMCLPPMLLHPVKHVHEETE